MSLELKNIVESSGDLLQVKKSELRPGDEIRLKTQNSIYNIKADKDGYYVVTGGWFDKMSKSPVKININGCTWGGSIIKTDIIAACGLNLEFSNKLLTSTIQKIIYFSREIKN